MPIRFVFILLVVFFSHESIACACCADPGHASDRESPLEYESWLSDFKQIKNVTVSSKSDCPLDEKISGIKRFSVKWSASTNQMILSHEGSTITLQLNKHVKLSEHYLESKPENIDPHETLEKGWQAEGNAIATGIFEKPLEENTGFAIRLNGYGNRCNNITDYRSFELELLSKGNNLVISGTPSP